jgi:hypothetical protein
MRRQLEFQMKFNFVLASIPEPDKVSLVAAFSKGVNAKGLQAGKFIGNIAKICGIRSIHGFDRRSVCYFLIAFCR